jgi:long-chain acyl-CoA synthetase
MKRELDKYNSIPEAFFSFANLNLNKIVYSQAEKNSNAKADLDKIRDWKTTNYKECKSRVLKLISYLNSIGLKSGDKVAIISQSRPEWMEADLAILSLGGVSVSVYQSLPASEIGYILFDSEAKVVFVENKEQANKILWLSQNDIEISATEERPSLRTKVEVEHLISFEDFNCPGIGFFNTIIKDSKEYDENSLPKIMRDHEASFVYTSGTTGPPKGVVQTHGNHLSNCRQAWVANMLQPEYSIMVFLPLAHSFAKLMGYLGMLSNASLKFPAIDSKENSKMNPESITKDIREGSADIVPIVPRMLEKMQSGILAKTKSGGLGALLVKAVINSSKEMQNGRANFKNNFIYKLTAGIRQKIKIKLFGNNFKYCISGGAKLNVDTAYFFDMLGIEVLEGYGLTETCVATNVNPVGKKKIGTVGPVLDNDIILKIAEDGEILYKGPNIAKGYYKRIKATESSWDKDGWFHTGDLGSIDSDGYLSIVGRKKDILVTSYGKNIAPESIEAKLKSSQYISQAVLVGDGRPYCAAIITLDEAAIRNLAKVKPINLEGADNNANSELRKIISEEIEAINKALSNHEQIRNFIIAKEDFTIENGLLTPTFKVKKQLVLKMYNDYITEIYN